jgi:hypothetical protein
MKYEDNFNDHSKKNDGIRGKDGQQGEMHANSAHSIDENEMPRSELRGI